MRADPAAEETSAAVGPRVTGYAPLDDLLGAARATDLFLYDLKFADDALHLRYTGASNAPILANLEALAHAHGRIWLRIPLIPGVNDGDSELDAMARLACPAAPHCVPL